MLRAHGVRVLRTEGLELELLETAPPVPLRLPPDATLEDALEALSQHAEVGAKAPLRDDGLTEAQAAELYGSAGGH